MKLKRTFLVGLTASLIASAMFGIVSLFLGQFWSFQFQVILTMLTTSLFSLTALLATLVLEKKTWQPAMILSIATSLIGFLFYITLIWAGEFLDTILSSFAMKLIAKSMWLIAVWAIALPHTGLLSQVRLVGVMRYAKVAAITVTFLLASTITIVTIFDDFADGAFIVIGVLAILTLLGTICVPILHKIQGIDINSSTESTAQTIQLNCPRCSTKQAVQTGHSRCVACRLIFKLEIEEPRCPKCSYLLHQLTSPQCPECGHALAPEEVIEDIQSNQM